MYGSTALYDSVGMGVGMGVGMATLGDYSPEVVQRPPS
jgi:hypothetical protein